MCLCVCVYLYIIIYSRYLTAQMWFRGMTVRILPSNLQSEGFAVSFQWFILLPQGSKIRQQCKNNNELITIQKKTKKQATVKAFVRQLAAGKRINNGCCSGDRFIKTLCYYTHFKEISSEGIMFFSSALSKNSARHCRLKLMQHQKPLVVASWFSQL